MRTLVISDLHLGQRPRHDVLRSDEARQALLRALDGIDRLVLLGDIVEATSRLRGRRAMEIAAPVLREIAGRMGDREIVLVPGNHDGAMVRPWALARGGDLGTADKVPRDATPTLAAVCNLLAGPPLTVRYPGVWLREDVWATHGHYIDHHLIPESTFGLPRGRLRLPPRDAPPARAIEYELGRRRSRDAEGLWARLAARPLATVLETLAELTRYGTFLLRGAHLTTLTSRLLGLQVRHGAVPAMALTTRRLGIDARWVVFGHVHHAGPAADERWEPLAGGPRVVNTGSWVYEPLLLDDAVAPHPYWPGGAVLITDDAAPEILGLLDAIPGKRLASGRRQGR